MALTFNCRCLRLTNCPHYRRSVLVIVLRRKRISMILEIISCRQPTIRLLAFLTAHWAHSTTRRQDQNQLTSAQGPNGVLSAQYDPSGNLVNLVVSRQGNCGPIDKCCSTVLFMIGMKWGQLGRARRWDYTTIPVNDPPYPQVPADLPAADLAFIYHQSQRIVKAAVNPGGSSTYTVNVFASLRLDGATWDGNAINYVRTAATESAYLGGVGHVVYDVSLPTLVGGDGQHLFYEVADRLGSTSSVFDRDTGEPRRASNLSGFWCRRQRLSNGPLERFPRATTPIEPR